LILREKTERIEGLGSCCVLSRFDDAMIGEFLADPEKYRRAPPENRRRPTDVIFDALLKPGASSLFVKSQESAN
jgi:hypothetical protein